MSVQIFLQGKIQGIEQFVTSGGAEASGRSGWVSLLCEVLPRALLAELGLSRLLLGASGGGQFLLVLPVEVRDLSQEFLRESAERLRQISDNALRLIWWSTENLGDWSIVRRRLSDERQARVSAPLAAWDIGAAFSPVPDPDHSTTAYFLELPRKLRGAQSVGWDPETPEMVVFDQGKHSWSLGPGPDSIPLARHMAPGKNETAPAGAGELGKRARGRRIWGVLRGDVDLTEARLARAQSVEELIQLLHMYKQFFASELEMLCSQPEFWQKVSILYTGDDEFAVYGAWDALVALAREVHRLFERFVETNLTAWDGPEGKTISMALAIASGADAALGAVFEDAGNKLQLAKTQARDTVYLFGRTIEWKHLNAAAESKNKMTRLVREFGCPPQFLFELASFYRDSAPVAGVRGRRSRNDRVDRPWRFHRRLLRVMHAGRAGVRQKEFQKSRADLIADFTGNNAAQVRLRPEGRVALEWARLETED